MTGKEHCRADSSSNSFHPDQSTYATHVHDGEGEIPCFPVTFFTEADVHVLATHLEYTGGHLACMREACLSSVFHSTPAVLPPQAAQFQRAGGSAC